MCMLRSFNLFNELKSFLMMKIQFMLLISHSFNTRIISYLINNSLKDKIIFIIAIQKFVCHILIFGCFSFFFGFSYLYLDFKDSLIK